ncbi:MAG: exonuclease domain-containing protein [Chloroflexi bacterium]|nr:exonuclease domain-containing protein [Chloroflexota bacterium]
MPASLGPEFVAVDLETTGLDASADRIIEIGAVRFGRDGVTDRFQTLVRPGIPIPPGIRLMTSITDEDVRDAPPPARAVSEFAVFAGGRPLVGHNVAFDLGFLMEAGAPMPGPSLDTYELASVLLPTSDRLDLASLAAALGVELDQHHRALPDAEATAEVMLALLDRVDALSSRALRDLASLAGRAQWALAPLFEDALAARSADVLAAGIAATATLGRPEPAPLPPPLHLGSHEEPHGVTDEDVERLFAEAGRSPDLLPHFEARTGQAAMGRAVAANIGHAGHLAVEAGTGTGKSLAYLLPALLHALRNDDRVIVSTQTLNLQEQLAARDLPAAAAVVERAEEVAPGTLRAAVLKGRANYLCLERWTQTIEANDELAPMAARVLGRVAVWLDETERGEVSELYLRNDERPNWQALSADSNDCLARRCAFVREGSCFLQRARAEAAAAHVVVANHALLLANAASDDQVLPPFHHLVVDEAHRLEAVATSQFSGAAGVPELNAIVEESGTSGRGSGSLAGALRTAAMLDPMPLSPAAGLAALADDVATAAARVQARIPDLEAALLGYIEEFAEQDTEQRVSITPGRRAQPLWGDVEEAALHAELAGDELARRLDHAREAVEAQPADSAITLDGLRTGLMRTRDDAALAAATLREGVQRADPGQVVWLSADRRGPRVRVAPLDVGPRLTDELYARRDSVLATSATLTSGGSFAYSVRGLGLFEPDTLDVGSPFDYQRAALVIVVEDVPEPEAPGYAVAAHDALAAATRAVGGRTLSLFTSHGGVRAAADALRGRLSVDDIAVLAHDVDGGPARLLRALATRPRSLVLGTASFWEGVDVRGPALSQLAVARLPFPVPTDPIHAARAAQYEDPFAEYTLPQAVLRFRQGFGRLIRSSEDRGVFLVLDRRVLSRDYGETFLDALPDSERLVLPTRDLGGAISDWLAPADA